MKTAQTGQPVTSFLVIKLSTENQKPHDIIARCAVYLLLSSGEKLI